MSQSTTFVAVYRGKTVSTARIVGVGADPALVAEVCGRLLGEPREPQAEGDAVLRRLDQGHSMPLRASAHEVVPA